MLRSVFIWWKRNDTVFCWMGSMYQLLSVWNVLFHSLPINHQRLRPKDRSWKRSPFFPPFFFRILPSDYRTADCLHSCFFFLLSSSFPLSPLVSTHSKSSCAMAAQLPLLRAYRLCQIVRVTSWRCRWWHTATGWRGQPNVSADAARGQAVIGQRGWEGPRDSVLSEGGHVKKLTLLVLPHLFEFDRKCDWKFEINISKMGSLNWL